MFILKGTTLTVNTKGLLRHVVSEKADITATDILHNLLVVLRISGNATIMTKILDKNGVVLSRGELTLGFLGGSYPPPGGTQDIANIIEIFQRSPTFNRTPVPANAIASVDIAPGDPLYIDGKVNILIIGSVDTASLELLVAAIPAFPSAGKVAFAGKGMFEAEFNFSALV